MSRPGSSAACGAPGPIRIRGGVGTRRLPRRGVAVQQAFNSLPILKYGIFLGGTSTFSPSWGSAPCAGAVAEPEAPEAADLDLLAVLQGAHHALERSLHDDPGLDLGCPSFFATMLMSRLGHGVSGRFAHGCTLGTGRQAYPEVLRSQGSIERSGPELGVGGASPDHRFCTASSSGRRRSARTSC